MASSASLKYGSLFGEDSPPSRSLGELAGGSGGSKAMAGTRPGLFHAGGPSATLSSNDRRYPGLFDDDVETMQPPPTATATPKAGLFADDGVANMAVTSIYNKTRAVPEAMNAQPIPSNPPEIPLSEDDESMFEMKYYEERARRIKLEARILELEKMVLSLRGQLALDACGSVGANVGSLDDLLSDVVLQSISTGRNEAGETCPEDTGTGSECRQAATVQERELARRQRHQRRPVSLTSRRLGLHSNKSFPVAPEHQFDSSSNIEDILPDLVMYETHETSHTEPTCGTTAREEISNVLSWSSDEDVKSGPSTVTGEVNSQEGVVNPQEKNIQDDAVSRRRQKAYRAALASRPTSRRLGNGRYSSARHVKPQIPAAENEPGHVGISGYEKWSESEESADGGGVSSAPMHNPENSKSRNDSIEWDSDGEQIGRRLVPCKHTLYVS